MLHWRRPPHLFAGEFSRSGHAQQTADSAPVPGRTTPVRADNAFLTGQRSRRCSVVNSRTTSSSSSCPTFVPRALISSAPQDGLALQNITPATDLRSPKGAHVAPCAHPTINPFSQQSLLSLDRYTVNHLHCCDSYKYQQCQ
jgi:hypothetical protein